MHSPPDPASGPQDRPRYRAPIPPLDDRRRDQPWPARGGACRPRGHRPLTSPRKSLLLSFVLTFFFGPLGMVYSTIGGALVMGVLVLLVALTTAGAGTGALWPVCIAWGMWSAHRRNERHRRLEEAGRRRW